MSGRLICFLGMGPIRAQPPFYEPVQYSWNGTNASRTPILQRALCEHFSPAGVVVLGTDDVLERWGTSGLLHQELGRSFDFRTVPKLRTESERWQFFKDVVGSFSLEPVAKAGETHPPDHFIVDITHGFRSQPILGMAALSFVVSDWARNSLGERAPSVRVVYGAYEAAKGEPKVAPIWDLTEFVTAARWNSAFDAFMRFGRADDLSQLASQESKRVVALAVERNITGPNLSIESFLKKLGNACRNFADDLALARTRDLLTRSSRSLLEVLESTDCETWLSRFPLLEGPVTLLRRRVASLCSPDTVGDSGLRAMGALATAYADLQRFAELAITMREGLVTHFGRRHKTLCSSLLEPGQRANNDDRKAIDYEWQKSVDKWRSLKGAAKSEDTALSEFPLELKDNVAIGNDTQGPRNDLEHGGFNHEPMSAPALRAKLSELLPRFRALVDGTDREMEPPATHRPLFVNISNHRVDSWSSEQSSSASDLCLGDLVDLDGEVPVVSPEADLPDLALLAEDIVERALRQGVHGAHVATEPVLTLFIVQRLQRRGVRCFCATTHREVEERVHPDGSLEKTSTFRFVRWREYPPIT